MSDLNDLIHTNAHNAFEVGARTERERILQELDELLKTLDNKAMHTDYGLANTLRELVTARKR
jgi:hypothetical protein